MSTYQTRNGSTVKNLTVKRACETQGYAMMRAANIFDDGLPAEIDTLSVLEGEVFITHEEANRQGRQSYMGTWYPDGRVNPSAEHPMDIVNLNWPQSLKD